MKTFNIPKLPLKSIVDADDRLNKKPNHHLAKLQYFVNLVSNNWLFDKKIKTIDSFVNLSYSLLEDQFGKRFTKIYRDILVENNFIEIDHTFKLKQKCKGYRINPAMRDNGYEYIQITGTFANKMSNKSLNSKPDDVLAFLKMNQKAIYISDYNTKMILNTISKNDDQDVNAHACQILSSNSVTDKQKVLVHQLMAIYHHNFRISEDLNGNRIHSNISNLSKELLPYIEYISDQGESKELVEIDFSCMQPTLIGLMALESDLDNDKQKINEFIDMCQDEDIYTKIMNEVGYEGSRSDFKNLFFGSVYSHTLWVQKNKVYQALSNMYTDIVDYMVQTKKHNYKNLAIQAQKVESSFVKSIINEVRLASLSEPIFILTRYDSFIVDADYLYVVQDIINKVSMKRFGRVLKTTVKSVTNKVSA